MKAASTWLLAVVAILLAAPCFADNIAGSSATGSFTVNVFEIGNVFQSTPLGESVVAGDVVLCDGPVNATNNGCLIGISDILHFFNNVITGPGGLGTGNEFKMFTLPAHMDDINDVAFPFLDLNGNLILTNASFISESTSAPVGGNVVTPFLATNSITGNTNTYNIIDHVPEPATLVLFGSGLLGIAGFVRRRKKP